MRSKDLRICALSDTHGRAFSIPDCDIFCHCGDWSPLRIQNDYESMFKWLNKFVQMLYDLPCKYVVIIAGNHDFVMESETATDVFDEIQEQLGYIKTYIDEKGIKRTEKKIHYLDRTSVELMGAKFWGTPVTRQVNRYRKYWAFEKNRPDYDIPKDTDIILTHQPSDWGGLGNVHYGLGSESEELGCKYLTNAVVGTHAKYHLCGHIHTGNHEGCIYPNGPGGAFRLDGTHGINVSMLDEDYEEAYKPFELIY